MVVNIIGIQNVDFESRDGSRIEGTNLYTTYDDEFVKGMKAEKFFIRRSIDCSKLKVGLTYDLTFDRRGKVEKIVEVSDIELS